MMLVGTDNSAYMMLQAMIFLHKNPEWLAAMNEEQARLQAQYGPEMGRQVCMSLICLMQLTPCIGLCGAPSLRVFRHAYLELDICEHCIVSMYWAPHY